MGQRLARHYMDDGVRLYHVQRRSNAVSKWHAALARLRRAEDRFITMGYLAQAYCETGRYDNMLTFAMHQLDLANQSNDAYMKDYLLELQVCVGLGQLFTWLRDLRKALIFLQNAVALLKTVTLPDVAAKYRALVLCQLASTLRKSGALADARAAAEEALALATENGHAPVQARCLHALGDIHFAVGEKQLAIDHYERAYDMVRALNDRGAQLAVLASMAKAAAAARAADSRHCECHALQLNKRCLELARDIGAKLEMLKCHARLAALYRHLSDSESESVARGAVNVLTQQLDLYCNYCGHRYGKHDEPLQALSCSHLFHQKCLERQYTPRQQKVCPKCVSARRAAQDSSTSSAAPSVSGYESAPATYALYNDLHRAHLQLQAHLAPAHSSAPPSAASEGMETRFLSPNHSHIWHQANPPTTPRRQSSSKSDSTSTALPLSRQPCVDMPSSEGEGSARSTTPHPALKDVFPYDAPSVQSISLSETPRGEGANSGDNDTIGSCTPIAQRDAESAAANLRAAASILADELGQRSEAQMQREQDHAAFGARLTQAHSQYAMASTSSMDDSYTQHQSAMHSDPTGSAAKRNSTSRWLGTTNPDMHHQVVALAEGAFVAHDFTKPEPSRMHMDVRFGTEPMEVDRHAGAERRTKLVSLCVHLNLKDGKSAKFALLQAGIEPAPLVQSASAHPFKNKETPQRSNPYRHQHPSQIITNFTNATSYHDIHQQQNRANLDSGAGASRRHRHNQNARENHRTQSMPPPPAELGAGANMVPNGPGFGGCDIKLHPTEV